MARSEAGQADRPHPEFCRRRHGPSSFRMHDPHIVFGELQLKAGDRLLDLGCGPGDYAMEAARTVGASGVVCALDHSVQLILDLAAEALSRGLTNVHPVVADITGPLPLQGRRFDLCLLATVLHMPAVAKGAKTLFTEIHRVLKWSGRLAVIECKREEMPFGPPISMRWSPEDVEVAVSKHGFKKLKVVDLDCNYMILFAVE